MSNMNRRDMCTAMAAFSILGSATLAAEGQEQAGDDLTHARVYRFSEMKVTNKENGGWSRAILEGTLPTGEAVEAHETMLPPGQMPHPPHKHRNTELILIREGKIEYQFNDKTEMAGPGDVLFNASGVMHGMKNMGTTNALYFVVSVSKKMPV